MAAFTKIRRSLKVTFRSQMFVTLMAITMIFGTFWLYTNVPGSTGHLDQGFRVSSNSFAAPHINYKLREDNLIERKLEKESLLESKLRMNNIQNKNKKPYFWKKNILMSLNNSVPGIPKPPPLPQCPPDYKPVADYVVLDTLRSCGDWKKYQFEPELELWKYKFSEQCDGRYVVYDSDVALLRDVILDYENTSDSVTIKTGADGSEVRLNKGFFKMVCSESVNQWFKGANHLTQYQKAISLISEPILVYKIIQPVTIVLTRYEYQNIYHMMSDLYNAFLVSKFFGWNTEDINIVFVDNHPTVPLETVWRNVFKDVFRIWDLPSPVEFQTMVWNIVGYSSRFLSFSEPRIPYFNEFSEVILRKHGIKTNLDLDCHHLKVTMISRRDLYDYSKNSTRIIIRKIQNEADIVTTLKRKYPDWKVKTQVMENLTFEDQLKLISKSDVLIGMHGAGLTFATFLPGHAGVIEFIPKYWDLADEHFQGICRWRKLHYIRWQNQDDANEVQPGVETIIPPTVMLKYMGKMMEMMC